MPGDIRWELVEWYTGRGGYLYGWRVIPREVQAHFQKLIRDLLVHFHASDCTIYCFEMSVTRFLQEDPLKPCVVCCRCVGVYEYVVCVCVGVVYVLCMCLYVVCCVCVVCMFVYVHVVLCMC